MRNYMLYNGMPVSVMLCLYEEFNTLQLDASRIMGLAPAKSTPSIIKAKGYKIYLDPPKEGSDTWKYANQLLSLEWPVVKIWIGNYLIVEESSLQSYSPKGVSNVL